MYDELIKRLREFASIPEHCENVDNCDKCSKEDICLSFTNKRIIEVATQAADAVEELSKPRWIPVSERLPDVFKHVLVNIPGMSPHPTVQEAFREKNGMWYSNGFRYGADEVTHWMPLPEPPKEEA